MLQARDVSYLLRGACSTHASVGESAGLAHLYQGGEDGLGSAAVEGVSRRDVEAVLDDIQVPVGQVGHRKAQQRLRGRGSRVSNGRSVCQDLRQPMTLSMVRRC